MALFRFCKMKSSLYHLLWENSVHVGIQTMKGAHYEQRKNILKVV